MQKILPSCKLQQSDIEHFESINGQLMTRRYDESVVAETEHNLFAIQSGVVGCRLVK